MKRSIRLRQWPFATGEAATLRWLRSPWQSTLHRQWRMTAVFGTADGQWQELEVPWGMVALLRLGQVFQDGELIGYDTASWRGKIAFSKPVSVQTSSLEAAVSAQTYPLLAEADGNEQCWVIQDASKKVIVPMIEGIRAFLAPNKTFAYGLLEPNFLERITIRNEIIENRLLLELSADIAWSTLNNSLVVFLARLLHDDSFLASWRSVYNERFLVTLNHSYQRWSNVIPLSTRLPKVSRVWTVRGVGTRDEIFVQEILQVSPARRLPFQGIYVKHPDIKHQEAREQSAEKQQLRRQPNADAEIDVLPESPISPRSPRKVASSRLAVLNSGQIQVVQVPQKTSFYRLGKVSEEEELSSEPEKNTQTVTFSDVAARGKHPAAEVKVQSAEEFPVDPLDGLDDFARAIAYIRKNFPQVEIDWQVQPIERDIPFARWEGRVRKNALVKFTWPDKKSCCLLEMGRPDQFQISSLLFTISQELSIFTERNRLLQHESITNHLINDALIPSGGWNGKAISEIRNNKQASITCVRHLTQKQLKVYSFFGDYIYCKVVNLLKLESELIIPLVVHQRTLPPIRKYKKQ